MTSGAAAAEPSAVRKDAETLRSLLEKLLPEYRATRSDVRLASHASASVREFWDVLGYTPAFRPFVNSPDDDSGRSEVEQILKGWYARARDKGPLDRLRALWRPAPEPITLARLPRRFRFVGVSDRWDAFYITDEASAVEDPPVLAVTKSPAGTAVVHASYLRRVTAGLLQKAFNVSGCDAVLSPPQQGPRPLPTLAPHLMALADGIWRLTEPQERSDRMAGYGNTEKLGFASWDRLIEYVHGMDGVEIGRFHTTNGCFVPVKTDMKDTILRLSKLRRFKYPHNGHEQIELVGWVEDIPAWITLDLESQEMTGLSVSNENRDRMLAWIDAHAVASAET